MEQVLLVVQVIVAMGLIGLVLIQRSDSDGFGLSGGSGNNLLSGRGAANALTRLTAIFAAAFLINSLALGVLASRGHAPSIAEKIEQQQSTETPVVPSVPLVGADKVEKKADAKADATAEKKPESIKPAAKKKPAADEPAEDHNE